MPLNSLLLVIRKPSCKFVLSTLTRQSLVFFHFFSKFLGVKFKPKTFYLCW